MATSRVLLGTRPTRNESEQEKSKPLGVLSYFFAVMTVSQCVIFTHSIRFLEEYTFRHGEQSLSPNLYAYRSFGLDLKCLCRWDLFYFSLMVGFNFLVTLYFEFQRLAKDHNLKKGATWRRITAYPVLLGLASTKKEFDQEKPNPLLALFAMVVFDGIIVVGMHIHRGSSSIMVVVSFLGPPVILLLVQFMCCQQTGGHGRKLARPYNLKKEKKVVDADSLGTLVSSISVRQPNILTLHKSGRPSGGGQQQQSRISDSELIQNCTNRPPDTTGNCLCGAHLDGNLRKHGHLVTPDGSNYMSISSVRQVRIEAWFDIKFPTWRRMAAANVRIQDVPGHAYSQLVSAPHDRDVFVMDSGAGFHMTPHRDLLQAYMEREHPMFPRKFCQLDIIIANGERQQVHGIGNIYTGAISLEEVLHIPGMAVNLVSASQLIDQLTAQLGQGARQLQVVEVSFREESFAIIVGKAIVGEGPRVGDIYHVRALRALRFTGF